MLRLRSATALGSSAYITTEMRSIREDLWKTTSTEQNGYATQFLAYMPFGETLAEQQNGTSYYSPFKFSAKEKDQETGYSYFGARYYSPELSVWLSVDPLSDKYPSLSAYNYCALNPVMLVDPDGREPGDFVDEKGKKIGNDGRSDGKMYVINTSQGAFIENGVSVAGAGLSKKQAKAAKSFVQSNSGNTSAFDANPSIYDSFTEIEGSSEARQAMVDIVNADNGRGGTSDANNREHGGGIMPDGQVVAGSPGDKSNPHYGAKSGTYPKGAKTTFHSHPSGTVTTGGSDPDPFSTGATIGGATSTTGYRQAPSPQDILNAGSGVRYVFGRASGGTVYIYNNQGVRATIPQRHFVTPQN